MHDNKIEQPKSLTVQNDVSNINDNLLQPHDLKKITQGDLYVVGKLWIEILKVGLLGTKSRITSIIPVVEAAKPPPPPSRPPKMKYKDLPLYTTPHYDYKDYEEAKSKCPQAKKKIIHECLYPRVACFRKNLKQTGQDFCAEYQSAKNEAHCIFVNKKNEFKRYMRDDQNLRLRQAVLALGGLTGYYIGSRKPYLIPRTVLTGAGLLAAGALCFPKDTDETFRAFAYTTAKLLIAMYNKFCGNNFGLRERIPCQSDVPPPLPKRKPNVCPLPKKK